MSWEPLRRLLGEWHARQERSRLWRIARRLDTLALTMDDEADEPLVPEDFLVPESRASRHFLGYYSVSGIEYALRRYGLWERMEDAAPSGALRVEIDDTAERLQRLRVLDAADGAVVGEIRAGIQWREDRQWLYVDWILSQRPGGEFPPDRPRLPGQEHPGGGIGRELMEIVLLIGHRLHCEGVMGIPWHFHNAFFYRLHFRFEEPERAGFYRAVKKAWRRSDLNLADASRAVAEGGLRRVEDGEVLRWEPRIMLAPLVPGAEFQDDGWEDAAERAYRSFDLEIVPVPKPDAER